MMLMTTCQPLRYRVSSWRQLPKCKSNNSRQLSIKVTDFIQDARLSGFRISVFHEDFGVLFACVLNASGNMITEHSENVVVEFTPVQILAELKKYGFLITYDPIETLSGDQLQYLMTLKSLHFDKIRILDVWKSKNNVRESHPTVVAFNIAKNPNWLNNDYSASESEFTEALNNGSAINITAISKEHNYSWSWLAGFVANIDDILTDNAEAKVCQ